MPVTVMNRTKACTKACTKARITTQATRDKVARALFGGNPLLIVGALAELAEETGKPVVRISEIPSQGTVTFQGEAKGESKGEAKCIVDPQTKCHFKKCIVVVDVPIQFFLKYEFAKCELVFLPGCIIEAHEVSLSWTRVWGHSAMDCRRIRTHSIRIAWTKAPIYVHDATKYVTIASAEKGLAKKPRDMESLVTENCSPAVAAKHAEMI